MGSFRNNILYEEYSVDKPFGQMMDRLAVTAAQAQYACVLHKQSHCMEIKTCFLKIEKLFLKNVNLAVYCDMSGI